MAAGKVDGLSTAGSDAEEETLPQDTSDLTPLKTLQKDTDRSMPQRTFRVFDAALVLISLVTYLTDALTDILVTVQYFQGGHYAWGGLTVGLIVLPSFITQCFSLRWYHADDKLHGARMWLVHIFHLQPLERYISVLMVGMDARSSGEHEKLQAYYYQQNDVSMLRLFEAFLESAPQLTLQLYIMVATNDATWLTAVSAGVSLVSVGWAVSVYNHALRQAHRDDYRLQWPSLFLHTVWHIGVVAARVCALVAFTSLYKAWVFLFLGVHWVLMTMWVILQKTDFCPTQPEERLFNAVVGVIYIYCFFSLKEGQTRWRLLFFYTVFFVENVVLVAVWYPFREEDGWTTNALVAVVFGSFFLGIGCMMAYYRFCHPSGPIYCCPPRPEQPSPSLPRKASGIYQLQVDLMPRTSTALLPRKAQLKPQTSLAMAAPPVVYKEVHTPSQLTPVRQEPGCRRVINYNETMEVSDTSMFRHYSIEASQCMVVSRCGTLIGEGVDLTQATLDEGPPEPAYSFMYMDEDQSQEGSGGDSGCSSTRSSHRDGGRTTPESIQSAKDSGCDQSSPEALSSSSECEQLSSGHGSAFSPNLSSPVTPATPQLPHSTLLSVLPDFSPIPDFRKPGTNAGCSKFPTTWQQMAAIASTPHSKLRPLRALFQKVNDEVTTDLTGTDSVCSLRAPLASPELSLTDSMCNLDDATPDDTADDFGLNHSTYDNVPSVCTENTLGCYLDNVSGLTYTSQGGNVSALSYDQNNRGPALSIDPSQTSPCII